VPEQKVLEDQYTEIFNIASGKSRYRIHKKLTKSTIIKIIEKAEQEKWTLLNLTDAGLEEIPKEIGRLKDLKILRLKNVRGLNSYFSLPNELFDLENLEVLDLGNSKIDKLPLDITNLKNLKCLHLYRTNIIDFPRQIFEMHQLEELSLPSNINAIPIEIENLVNLKHLGIINTSITSLPEQICSMKNLEDLFLSGNNLTYLPEQIGNLRNLKFLNLSESNITSLPEQIGNLRNLKVLNLAGSNIISLPEQIGNLKHLSSINLSRSKIEVLPKSLKNITKLKRLELKNTHFTAVLPPEILNQNPNEIINFIITYQQDDNKIKLNESKMLIVGQGNVGKSSLLHRLIHDKYYDANELTSTEGIDIAKWSFSKDQENYNLNVWDFGGQEIYHSTHQFFLTNRSLYILVWDARQEDEYGRIDYWLNTVESFAGDSPILLVINKCDERKNVKYIDLKNLKRSFPQIIDAYKVSCKTGKGISILQEAIKEETIHLPLMDVVWLSSWLEVRQHLKDLSASKNLITYSEYKIICEKYHISEMEAKSLSKYLHDLGVIIHFHEDILLRNIVILNPEWGTDAVYKVLDAEDDILKDRNGILYYDDLSNIWKERDIYSEDKFPLILRLMENFQLSFEVEKNKMFLIPELMDNQEIEIDEIVFDKNECLTFQYNYDFLPAGIMTRFIVKSHDYLLERDNRKLCWKKGAFLHSKDSIGKVRLFDNLTHKRIEITITGPNLRNKQDLLNKIRTYFDQIHNSIKKLKVTEVIMCNCSPNCQNLFDYNKLLRFEANGIYEDRCDKSLKLIDVLKLLDGIQHNDQRQKCEDESMEYTPINISINNTNTNTNTNTISIEIRNTIDGLQGDINDLKDEVVSENPELEQEFNKLDNSILSMNNAESKEQIIRSGALQKFNRFLNEIGNEDSSLGQTIKNMKYGISIVQDIAGKYNKIAEWCGFPVIPSPFLKNK
jgi:internalin A